MPTLKSAKAAAAHYSRAGGTAKIFINDDGLLKLLHSGQSHEFHRRASLYSLWSCILGMVARPAEGRDGKESQAGNMNFCLRVAVEVTQLMGLKGLSATQAREEVLNAGTTGRGCVVGAYRHAHHMSNDLDRE